MTEFTPLDAMREWKARALAAEAKLAKVRALAEEWKIHRSNGSDYDLIYVHVARRLREALGEPDPKAVCEP